MPQPKLRKLILLHTLLALAALRPAVDTAETEVR